MLHFVEVHILRWQGVTNKKTQFLCDHSVILTVSLKGLH